MYFLKTFIYCDSKQLLKNFVYTTKFLSFLGEDKNVEEDFEIQSFAKLLGDDAEGMKVWSVKINHRFKNYWIKPRE